MYLIAIAVSLLAGLIYSIFLAGNKYLLKAGIALVPVTVGASIVLIYWIFSPHREVGSGWLLVSVGFLSAASVPGSWIGLIIGQYVYKKDHPS